MLNRLVLPDWTLENRSTTSVVTCLGDRYLTETYSLTRYEYPLRVEPVKYLFEPLAFYTNQVFLRNEQAVKKYDIGIDCMPSMFAYFCSVNMISV